MENVNYYTNYIKQEWMPSDALSISIVPTQYNSNQIYSSTTKPVSTSYNLPPDFIDFIDLDGSSSTSDDWFCNDVNIESSSESHFDDCYSSELITPDYKDRNATLYEEAMKSLFSYSRNQCTFCPEYLYNNIDVENIQNTLTNTYVESTKGLIQNRNISNLNQKSQNTDISLPINTDALFLCSKPNSDIYPPCMSLSTSTENSIDIKPFSEAELEEKAKFLSTKDSANEATAINCNTDTDQVLCSYQEDFKDINVPTDSNCNSNIKLEQTQDIDNQLIELNKDSKMDLINLPFVEDDLNSTFTQNELFRGK